MPQNPPADMPRITPYLHYNNLQAALDWLQNCFGLQPAFSIPGPDGTLMHAEMRYYDGVIMMGASNAEQGCNSPQDLPGTNQGLYVYTDDVDMHFNHASKNGAKIVMPPQDMFWGDRMYTASDLEGHSWSFAQHVKDVAPEDMKPDF